MSRTSIIIPAFNQARFLSQAIESALGQAGAEVEVVVVDDGSTDETPEVIGRYLADPRFKSVRQPNTGLPGARNRGIAESVGDYLCFLDSDDYYLPEKVARQAALLAADPELGFVYCDITTVDDTGQPVLEQFSIAKLQRELSGNLFSSLMLGGFFPPHTVMIRRAVLDQVGGFDPDLGGHADYDLWLRVSGAGFKAVFLPETLAFYRTHADSMSKDGQHMAETRLATFRKMVRMYPERVSEGLQQLQQANHDLFLANQWLQRQWTERQAELEKQFLANQSLQQANQELHITNQALGKANQELHRQVESGGIGLPDDGRAYFLIPHVDKARLTKGQPDQVAIWEATIDGASSRAIYLQPPAELMFKLPTGARGTFTTAVAIHPEAWDKPDAGGCEFHLRIDDRLVFVVALDPAHLLADRHWHEIRLDIPGNSTNAHHITLATRSVGPIAYRWALWRSPTFLRTTADQEGSVV
jgi:glycosyltransferase involved in cell wall biosynthesis